MGESWKVLTWSQRLNIKIGVVGIILPFLFLPAILRPRGVKAGLLQHGMSRESMPRATSGEVNIHTSRSVSFTRFELKEVPLYIDNISNNIPYLSTHIRKICICQNFKDLKPFNYKKAFILTLLRIYSYSSQCPFLNLL